MPKMAPPEPVKLLMSWDIAPNQNQEYFEFVVRVFIPAVQNMGFELEEAWATAYGDRPQIQVGAVMPDIEQIMRVLRSPEWKELHEQLLTFVVDYQQKIVTNRSRFQF